MYNANSVKTPSSSPNISLLEARLWLLHLFSFWSCLFCGVSLISCPISTNEVSLCYVPFLTLFLIFGIECFTCFSHIYLHKKRVKSLKLIEKLSTILLLFVIIIQSAFSATALDQFIDRDEYILGFLTVVLLSDHLLAIVEKKRLKIMLCFVFAAFWSVFALKFAFFSGGELKTFKKLLQILLNTSLSLCSACRETKPRRPNDLPHSLKTSPKQSEQREDTKFNRTLEPLVALKLTKNDSLGEGKKTLFKFLNSLNSGILLYDKDMQLIFFTKKMRRFLHRSIGSIRSTKDEGLSSSDQENMTLCLKKIQNIKACFPEENLPENSSQLSSPEKSAINCLSQKSDSSRFPSHDSPMSFQSLLTLVKKLSNDSSHPMYNSLIYHHLIFHYILDTSSKTQMSLENKETMSMSFVSNPLIKYNEIRVSRIDFDSDWHLLFEFTNRTDKKLSGELNTMNSHKNKLLSQVAHEFRTPLNSIIGNLELLQDIREIPVQIRDEIIKPALFSSTLLLNYVNDILDFSQMRAQKLKLNYVRFNLPNHLSTIGKIMEVLARKKGVTFKKHLEPNLPAFLTSDPNRLSQILLNLLSNAFKFTLQNGLVQLHVSYDLNISAHRFVVSDSGIGISPENITKLFKEFSKIDSQESCLLNPSGVGLGLLISQKLAEEMGPFGNSGLKVESEIGFGTSFSFYLEDKIMENSASGMDTSKNLTFKSNLSSSRVENQKEGESLELKNKNFEQFHMRSAEGRKTFFSNEINNTNRSKTEEVASFHDASTHQRKGRLDYRCFPVGSCTCPPILVVDDDLFNVSYLQNLLEALGWSSEFAGNGEDASNKVRKRLENKCCPKCKGFKLVFMDEQMPVLDGIGATKEIKSFTNIIVIGCSGLDQPEDLARFLEAGADLVCPKPLSRNKIAEVLQTYKHLLE